MFWKAGKIRAFHASEIGASHTRAGKPCQDFSLSTEADGYAVAVVCDGHGGNKYFRSDRGSRIAAEQTMEAIHLFMKSHFVNKWRRVNRIEELFSNNKALMNQLAANIIYRWRECLAMDYAQEPFSEKELANLSSKEMSAIQQNDGWVTAYGTTLIAVVRTTKFWFGLHIGDGKCVAVNNMGEYLQPIPWDEQCFLNVTTSLCDEQALLRFRFCFEKVNLPLAIFIASDGVDDTFGSDEALYDFYQTVMKLFTENGLQKGVAELQSYLPTLSSKGSQDDISIAGIIIHGE